MSGSSKKKDCNCKKKTKVYTDEDLKKQSSNGSKISMVRNFATSLASRGLKNKKTTEPIKKLRVLSCFGDLHVGGELPPCQHLHESKTAGKYFCGGCGCGDKPRAWLVADGNEYSKLDYPTLSCPMQMPGFTDYSASDPDEAEEPVTRKYYIENVDYSVVDKMPVTTPEEPPKIDEE